MRGFLVMTLLVLATLSAGWGQARLPLTFDTDPGWEMRPHFLGNPTTQARIIVAEGANRLQVEEVAKGMKWELPLQPFDSGYSPYLLVRYKAENIGQGGYSLWVFDGSGEGLALLNPADLIADGQWHSVAIDLVARGVTGAVRAFVVEVQCARAPAYLALDEIQLCEEPPAGATVVPTSVTEEKELELRLAELPDFRPEPDWLAADAPRYGFAKEQEAVHIWAEGAPETGMKFSLHLPEAVDLTPFRYVTFRYKARGVAPWWDYCVWFGSGGGGMPAQWVQPLKLAQLKADGRWHSVVMTLDAPFKVVDMALQVSCAQQRGDLWMESIRFSTRRPLLEMGELLPYEQGWTGIRLKRFQAVDLTALANAAAAPRLRVNGLKSWLPAGQISVYGLPFVVPAGEKNVVLTPADIDEQATIPLGGQTATEIYLLLLSRLPATDAARMGDPVPMESFRNPERFRVRVEYADGIADEIFPLACGSGAFEVIRGPEVYCLTGLRPKPIRQLALVNRMESGSFMLAALTLNQGAAVTSAPPVQALPPAPKRIALPRLSQKAFIRREPAGYLISTPTGTMRLSTQRGLRLESLTPVFAKRNVVTPGPLFEIGEGQTRLDSTQVTIGAGRMEGTRLTIPVDARLQGVPLTGELNISLEEGKAVMWLELHNASERVIQPIVNFPVVRGVNFGRGENVWYLYCRKGGLLSNRPTEQRRAYGGEYPLQIADAFDPQVGGGLALCTYDLHDLYRFWRMRKGAGGIDWALEYWVREYQPGEKIETAPTALVPHLGDWREALAIYRQWVSRWFKPMVPRKRWFQEVFYYQQALAWSQLRDPRTGQWRMTDRIRYYKEAFGRLDYLHVFDFGASRIYGRVGDYSHYDELGGLEAMRAAFKEAQDQGVRIGVYIEGYLCDKRGVWGREHVAANCIIKQDGTPLMWPGSETETMMCPAALGWRQHLAETYKRVAAELNPDGMYIDQYGFTDTWKTCWSRQHGHPVPNPPLRGEGETLQAIRAAMPLEKANLTEETPNDVHAQYQDGALGYSVVSNDPVLAPHRVDLFRFVFPDFKIFQLVSYNPFVEGGWDLLKWPFFNGEGYWLHHDPQCDYCPDAKQFLRQAFDILHRYKDAFCSSDVAPLVPTLIPTVYANRFQGPRATVWTLFNAEFRTQRGELLRVPHRPGARYRNAFTGAEIKPRIEKGEAIIPVTIGPRDVGCIVAEYP